MNYVKWLGSPLSTPLSWLWNGIPLLLYPFMHQTELKNPFSFFFQVKLRISVFEFAFLQFKKKRIITFSTKFHKRGLLRDKRLTAELCSVFS